MKRRTGTLLAGALMSALASAAATAQTPVTSGEGAASRVAIKSAYVSLGARGHGILWSPQEGGARTGVVLVHPFASSLGNPLCAGLAQRGFAVLCADPPNTNRPYRFAGYEAQAQTIAAAIAKLREESGAGSVILAGHGEGGALAAFYQNVARNGPSACQGPEKLAPCDGARLSGLSPASALLLVDPDLGQAFGTLSMLDPAISVETAPTQRYPGLDMYDPRNGFDPGRNAASYPPAFRKAFHDAQGERVARLVAEARKLLSAVAARERDAFADDMPLFVAGALTTPLWYVDARLLSRTKRAHLVLTPEGPVTRVLECIGVPSGNPRESLSYRAAVAFSARQFLAGHAIATTKEYDVTEDDILGVVWASSATSALPNIAGVRDPLLVVANTAHFGVRPAEMIYDAAGAAQKELVGVDGATHFLAPCQACTGRAGARFGDTAGRALDHIADWLRRRS